MAQNRNNKPTVQKISASEIYGDAPRSRSQNASRKAVSQANSRGSSSNGSRSTGRVRSGAQRTGGNNSRSVSSAGAHKSRSSNGSASTSRSRQKNARRGSSSDVRVGTSYNTARPQSALYGKQNKSKHAKASKSGSGNGVLAAIVGAIVAIFAALGKGLATFFRAVFSNKVGRIVCIVVIVLAVVGISDTAMNWNKAFGNVKVGTVDVSGMNHDEIVSAVKSTYESKLSSKTAYLYVDETVVEYLKDEAAQAEDKAQAEQISIEQARNENKLWTATQTSVGARIPYDEIADQALAVGRENGGIIARIATIFTGSSVPVTIDYDDELINSLGNQIDSTMGDARIDACVTVKDGYASVIEPHDGYMVNRTTLKNQLTDIFTEVNAKGYAIPSVESAPSRISRDEAQKRADAVNQAIRYGANFTYEGVTWFADAKELGSWVYCGVVEQNGEVQFITWIDLQSAKKSIMKNVAQASPEGLVDVTFSKDANGTITVGTSGVSNAPDVAQGAVDINEALFGDNGTAWSAIAPSQPVTIELGTSTVPESLSLDDALSMGLVTVIGTYTTEYSTYSGTENRNYNIHLAADHINNSIVKANGGEWSFNDVAGYCNEEAGFKSAGIILDGEYTDSIGGGICQVATTVFNAVYESGLPITQRSNHSLYIASYPAGRDAAVSYPDLDLKWQDDLSSDVLLQTSYTDSTLTVTLYGVATGYTVESTTSAWETGEAYEVEQKVDESLATGTSYVSTTGVPASSISVTRTVLNKDGSVVSTQVFSSYYDAKNCVVTTGPDTEIDKDKYKQDDDYDVNNVRYQ